MIKIISLVCSLNSFLLLINNIFSLEKKVVNETQPPVWLIVLIIFALSWMVYLHFKKHYKKVTRKKE